MKGAAAQGWSKWWRDNKGSSGTTRKAAAVRQLRQCQRDKEGRNSGATMKGEAARQLGERRHNDKVSGGVIRKTAAAQ
jgi:hypothetical protein